MRLFQPLIATYKNVAGLANCQNWSAYSMLQNLMTEGYQVRLTKLNANDYGTPQQQVRVLLFAAKVGIPLPRHPTPTHGEDKSLMPQNTVDDAIGHMYDNEEWNNDKEFQTTALRGVLLKRDRPSGVVMAKYPPIHPDQERLVSVCEAAVIQSFPIGYKFDGEHCTDRYWQVRNAVPVDFAKSVYGALHGF